MIVIGGRAYAQCADGCGAPVEHEGKRCGKHAGLIEPYRDRGYRWVKPVTWIGVGVLAIWFWVWFIGKLIHFAGEIR